MIVENKMKNMKNPIPFIEFHITEMCNYRCEYCSEGKTSKDYKYIYGHANDKTLDGFVNLVKKLGPDWLIQFTGGEPFMHPKFIETAKRITDLGNEITIITNFSFPYEHFERLINECGNKIKRIQAAFHLSQIKNLDEMIDKAIKVYEIMPNKTNIEFKTVITEDNFEKSKYIEKRLNEHSIKFIFSILQEKNGNIKKYSNEIENFLTEKNYDHNRFFIESRKVDVNNVKCWAGCKLLQICYNGDVRRCYADQSIYKYDFLGSLQTNNVKLLDGPHPCFAKGCCCEHPAEKHMFYYDKNAGKEKRKYINSTKKEIFNFIIKYPLFLLKLKQINEFRTKCYMFDKLVKFLYQFVLIRTILSILKKD